MRKIKKSYNPIIIILVFLLVYNVPVFIRPRINTILFVGLVSWAYIFCNIQHLRSLKLKRAVFIYVVILFLYFYLANISLLHGLSLRSLNFLVHWGINVLPFSVMLTIYCAKHKYSHIDLLNIILIAGTLQGIAALAAFFSPTIKGFFVFLLNAHEASDIVLSLSDLRMYGYAGGLTNSTPILQSALFIIAFFLALTINWSYFLFCPLLFFSAVINARTSIIILLIGILIIVSFSLKIILKRILFFFFLGALFLIFAGFSISLIQERAPQTYNWISSGSNEIYTLIFEQQGSGYFKYLQQNSVYSLPDNISFFFGTGERVMGGNRYGITSDIGYINDIWLGGVVYAITIYVFFAWILCRYLFLSKKSPFYPFHRFIFLLYTLSLPVLNIKGYILDINDFISVFFILYIQIALGATENAKRAQIEPPARSLRSTGAL